MEKAEKRSRVRRKKIQYGAKVSRKKMHRHEMLGKSRNAVFSMICVSAGSKSNLAKAAGAEVAVERRHEKLHAAVARSTF